METLYHTNFDSDFFSAFPDLYHSKGYPYKSNSTVNHINSRKRAAEDYLSDENFQIPRFSEDSFSDLSTYSLAPGNKTVNNLQSVPVSQTHHHQPPSSGIGEHHLSASGQTARFNHSVNTVTNNNNNNNNNQVLPKFPPQTFYLPDISARNSLMSQTGDSMPYSAVSTRPNVFSIFGQGEGEDMSSPTHTFSTISQSQLSGQLGFQMQFKEASPTLSNSPLHSTSTVSPRRDSTSDSDENLPLSQLAQMRRTAPPVEPDPPVLEPMVLRGTTTKKQRAPRKKKKKDPNEPQKPVSAYALFFRDTQSAIKGQNPSATFGEVSKIVASMWEGLDDEHKSVYKKKTESAKKEYLKQIAAYRASQVVSQAVVEDTGNTSPVTTHIEKLPSPQRNHNENAKSPPQPGNFVDNGPVVNQQLSPPMDNNNYVLEAPHLIAQQPQAMEQSPPGYMTQTNYQPIAPRLSPEVELTPGPVLGPGRCVRNGCTNQSVESPAWDSEYCSNACVVSHCRDVFTAWVASRQTQNAFA